MQSRIQASVVSVCEGRMEVQRLFVWVDGKLAHTTPHLHKALAMQRYRKWLKDWKGA